MRLRSEEGFCLWEVAANVQATSAGITYLVCAKSTKGGPASEDYPEATEIAFDSAAGAIC